MSGLEGARGHDHHAGREAGQLVNPNTMTASTFIQARLVPELLVTNVNDSLRFWRDVCGFRVVFDRMDEGFAYLDLGGAQIMLEERGRGRNWITGPLEAPLGRG